MTAALTNFQFELSTGTLYAPEPAVQRVETGRAPRNLIQLHEMGRLLVGDVALLDQAADGSVTADIVPLAEALLDRRHYTKGKSVYEPLDFEDWGRQDYIAYGQWLHRVTRDPKKPTSRLTQSVLTQGYRLGLGPSLRPLTNGEPFDSVSDYLRSLKIIPRRKAYADWSEQQLADHAERVFLELLEATGRRTGYVNLNEEIDRRAKLGEGPSCEMFRTHGGGPMHFMTLNGYADTPNMEPADYVQWGVRFMRANNGRLPSREAINFLAITRRSPGEENFLRRFRWADYLEQVKEAHRQQQEKAVTERIAVIRQEVEEGMLPCDIFEGVPAEEIVAVRAKWLLVNTLFPKLVKAHKRLIAQEVRMERLTDVLVYTGEDHKTDETDIAMAAGQAGVKQDLWPTVEEPYLTVPEELLLPA